MSNTGLLVIAGNSYDLICFHSETGEQIWTDFLSRSSYMVEPQVTEIRGNATVVYAIEALNGNIRQHDAWDGTRNWEFNCENLTGVVGCQDGVEAEFTLSSTGNVLYYGDIFGKIVALKVADFATPNPTSTSTSNPTSVPTSVTSSNPTSVPTIASSPNPTSTPTTTTFSNPTSTPTTTSTFAPSSIFSKSPSQFISESETSSEIPTSESSISPVETVMPVKVSKPSYPPMKLPIMNTGSPSSLPSDSPTSNAGTINSSTKVDTESLGAKRNGTILISVIAVVASLVIGFLGLFAMQRHKNKRNSRSFIHDDSSEMAVEVCFEKVDPPNQSTFKEFCQTSSDLAVAEIEQKSPNRSTKKKLSKSPRKSPGPTTPSTLASITETDNEDATSHFDSALDAMSPSSQLKEKGVNNKISISKQEENVGIDSQEENGFLNTARSFFSMKQVDSPNDEDATLGFLPSSLSDLFDQAVTTPVSMPPDDDAASNSSNDQSASSHSGSSANSKNIDDPSDSEESQDHDEGDDVFDKLESYLPNFGRLFGRSKKGPTADEEEDDDDEKKHESLNDSTHAIHTKTSHDDWSIDSSSVYLDDERVPSLAPEGESLPVEQSPQKKVEKSGIWRSIISTFADTEKVHGHAPDIPAKQSEQKFTDNPEIPSGKDDVISCPDDERS